MNIFRSYKKTRFFLWINIIGLSIGLAASIMLILFVVNELSYDKHFANSDRIVRLLTVYERNGETTYSPINLNKAYKDVPEQVPGIEAAVQIYNLRKGEITYDEKRFQDISMFVTEPEFFKVFQMKFVEGTPESALELTNSAVITRKYADVIFGSPENAIGKSFTSDGVLFIVSAVVEPLPQNTHFSFDVLGSTGVYSWMAQAGGLEFHTYYLIKEEVSVEETRKMIEKSYGTILEPWGQRVGVEVRGATEPLGDVYLKSKSSGSLGTTSSMSFIWILSALSFLILFLAITNFINLYISKGEMRMGEIGIRKTNGAQISDIVRQFFSEVSLIVLMAFALGLFLAVVCMPYFGELINKSIDLHRLLSPLFIASILLLFVITVILSAFYPAIYLSRFSPLEILGKRITFSKRRLTGIIVVFQSIVSIILLSFILMLYRQTVYLEKLPIGYNPNQVMSVIGNQNTGGNFNAIKDELLKYPEVQQVSGSHHIFGGGCSGQVIAPWTDREKVMPINEYRVLPGLPELMELELVEGRFFSENDPDSIPLLLLNEAAVKALGGESPIGQSYLYHDRTEVVGVVKDFHYENPVETIKPIALFRVTYAGLFTIRFEDGVSQTKARQVVEKVFKQFDPDFVLDPIWSIDVYNSKFKEIKTITRIVLIGSLLSIFITMMGLLAVHLYSSMRRIREIGIRRVYGGEKASIFSLLSWEILKWIGFAAIIAIPAAIYGVGQILANYANHITPDWTLFAIPVLIQCVIALLTTSGVTLWTLSRNPIEAIKTE